MEGSLIFLSDADLIRSEHIGHESSDSSKLQEINNNTKSYIAHVSTKQGTQGAEYIKTGILSGKMQDRLRLPLLLRQSRQTLP